METIKLTSQQFLDLPTYSASNPTGTVIGKRWKRLNLDGSYYLCEYVACDDPEYVDITKKLIQIDNPEPVKEENCFIDWDKKVTMTYRRLVDICKLSYEYPKLPVSYWLSSKDWESLEKPDRIDHA